MLIGITGSFGSGKTTIAKMLAKKGAYIIDADKIAKQVFEKKKKEIKKAFFTADRKKIADIVFSDKVKLRKLNSLIHPVVRKEINKIIAKNKKKAIVIDAALLIESDMLIKKLDALIIVKCSKKEAIKRLMKKGFQKGDILRRMKNQMPIKNKIKYADYIIDNSSISQTKKQVDEIWKALLNIAEYN
ncbi:MAG TPA: dephospho-CoA kinase [archaeon]|nr:dephospho-CoA kinase [archaeon]